MDQPSKNKTVLKIGDKKSTDAKPVRIVHISDTHLHHNDVIHAIPPGDILIHSGDFENSKLSRKFFPESDYLHEVQEIDEFFAKLPHTHKIFVAGNHETNFSQYPVERTQSLLKNGIYLQDSSIMLEGIKFYGSPWNGKRSKSYARGFAVPYKDLGMYWDYIPTDTDVLVTHNPPHNILDLGLYKWAPEGHCELCGHSHSGYMHFGCRFLRQQIESRIKPKLHCFGHVHDCNDTVYQGEIVFSNAAMKLTRAARVYDYYVPLGQQHSDSTPINYHPSKSSSSCILQ